MRDIAPKNGKEIKTLEARLKHPHKMGLIYRIFCWCSGARLYLLKQCPTDYNKFFGIGAIVIMTGIMASLSGFYAIYSVFKNKYISLGFAGLWGTMIFFLDWYLVASLKKQNKLYREMLIALPRFLLSLFIALVISKPLELKLFEKEINQEIAKLKMQHSIGYNDLVDKEFKEIGLLEAMNSQLKEDIRKKEDERKKLFELLIAEAEGRSPTGKEGRGPVYKEKKAQFDKIGKELDELKRINQKEINKNNRLIEELNIRKSKKVKGVQQVNENYDGFLARLQAMANLTASNRSIAIANSFIILLFVLIESSPIIVKLMSKRGPYDEVLDKEEEIVRLDAIKNVLHAKMNYDSGIDLRKEVLQFKTDRSLNTQKEFIDELSNSQLAINKVKLDKWKEQELDKIENDNNENIQIIEEIIRSDFSLPTNE